ncbi:MAG TPA: PQQ-binding-like beta-propeller repeat protein [Pirellulaceae bacterium]|nr:PQQ-binding-like beta-propeller repeat protein [Pirellulaceae bacterium]
MSVASAEPTRELPAPRRYFPGKITCAIVIVAVALLLAVRGLDFVGDIAVVNILTLIFGFFAFMAIFTWFTAVSSYPKALRILTVVAFVGGVTLFFAFYRIEGVRGDLIPKFVSRFAPLKDTTLEKLEVQATEQARNPLLETTPEDFPQFLGPQRNACLPGPLLARDWQADPPKLVWKRPIGAGWSGFSVVNNMAITLEQRGDEELVTCYEVATGKPIWSHAEQGRHSTVLGGIGPRSTPTIHQGRVYTVGAAGVLLCLDGATGKVLWRVDLLKQFGTDLATDLAEIAWGRAASPLIVDDLVVVPAGGPPGKFTSLAAFKQETGEIVWRGGDRQISYASPALATVVGVRQILSVNEDTVTGHDPTTGAELWFAPWPGDSGGNASTSQPQVIGDNQVLVTKGYGTGAKLLQLSQKEGKLAAETVWELSQALKTKFTNGAIVDGHIYALSDGVLECVEVQTGEAKWKGKRRRAGDYGQGQLLAVGDLLLIQCEDGDVALVAASPESLQELGRFPALEGQTWNTLCLFGKYLLVRNGEEAACYELPLR